MGDKACSVIYSLRHELDPIGPAEFTLEEQVLEPLCPMETVVLEDQEEDDADYEEGAHHKGGGDWNAD